MLSVLVLGAARDWDVFCTETLLRLLRASARAIGRRRCKLRRKASAGWRTRRRGRNSAVPPSPGWSWQWRRGLSRTAQATRTAIVCGIPSPNSSRACWITWHARSTSEAVGSRAAQPRSCGLSKALQRLRYSVEFVSALYPVKQTRHHAKPTKQLLKLLGAANDAQVAASMAEGLGKLN